MSVARDFKWREFNADPITPNRARSVTPTFVPRNEFKAMNQTLDFKYGI